MNFWTGNARFKSRSDQIFTRCQRLTTAVSGGLWCKVAERAVSSLMTPERELSKHNERCEFFMINLLMPPVSYFQNDKSWVMVSSLIQFINFHELSSARAVFIRNLFSKNTLSGTHAKNVQNDWADADEWS